MSLNGEMAATPNLKAFFRKETLIEVIELDKLSKENLVPPAGFEPETYELEVLLTGLIKNHGMERP